MMSGCEHSPEALAAAGAPWVVCDRCGATWAPDEAAAQRGCGASIPFGRCAGDSFNGVFLDDLIDAVECAAAGDGRSCEQCGTVKTPDDGWIVPGNGMVICGPRCYGLLVGVPMTGS